MIKNYDATISEMLKLAVRSSAKYLNWMANHQRCAIVMAASSANAVCFSRRLVEAAAKFVEVSHNLEFLNGTGWDVHNQGMLKQHDLISELDHALATLVEDLEEKAARQNADCRGHRVRPASGL